MLMTEYETTVVLRPDLGGDAIEATLDRVRDVVKGGGGKLLGIDHWGKKKLAYEIDKHGRGVYVHTHYLGKGGLVAELERNLRISDTVVRYLTVKLAEQVSPDDREEKQYVQPQYDAEEAAAAEESEASLEDREANEGEAESDSEADSEADSEGK